MTQNLEKILSVLQTVENRITFLESAYIPGNTDIADELLKLVDTSLGTEGQQYSRIVNSEIKYAKSKADTNRVIKLAKRWIDKDIWKHDFVESKDIIKWGNVEVANYAIEKMLGNKREDMLEAQLKHSADIAAAFGKNDLATQLYKRVLEHYNALEIKYNMQFSNAKADISAKLGRFDEAIMLYTQKYCYLNTAIEIALKHRPKKVKKLAKMAFNRYRIGEDPQIYLEAAKLLGKIDKAKKVLAKEAEDFNANSWHYELVDILFDLNMMPHAKKLVRKIAEYELNTTDNDWSKLEQTYENTAELFKEAGEPPSKELYLLKIEAEIQKGIDASKILEDIEEGYNTTKDSIFLEKKVTVLGIQRNYLKAAQTATSLGKTNLAQTYTMMHQMVERVKKST